MKKSASVEQDSLEGSVAEENDGQGLRSGDSGVAPGASLDRSRKKGFSYRILIRCSFTGSSFGTERFKMPFSSVASVFSGRIGVGNRTRRW